MRVRARGMTLILYLPCLLAQTAQAADADSSFDHDIQPLLARCIACHGPGKSRGGLRLDQRAPALATLKTGHRAIVPGNPDQSELLQRVSSSSADDRMPPKGERLTDAEVATLRRWIAAGADWPVYWAYRPLARLAVPGAGNGAALQDNPIDRFVQARLTQQGLRMSPLADKRTLLRRVTLDLTGLLPTQAEQAAFLADDAPDSYERVVDRLLASPHFGERFARYWMDIVHFAETHGHDQDRPRENAWPYRDYLIRAFNRDTPYARFVQEQVAGDVLFPDDPWAMAATGFLAAGPWDESSLRDIREDAIDREIARYLDRDDIVSTVMSTFVSTTVHCARCHDHKFDPVSQQEYYALQAVFAGIDKANRLYDRDPSIALRRRNLLEQKSLSSGRDARAVTRLLAPALQNEVAAWEAQVQQSRRRWRVLEPKELLSDGGASLARLADGSVLSSGLRPDKDTYRVVLSTDGRPITGIRLEVLTDPGLPHQGPGRQENGNLHLNEFGVVVHSPDGSLQPLTWQRVRADFDQQGWTIAHAVDGNPATAWGIYPMVGRSHQGIFALSELLALPPGSTLAITMQQSHGGGHLIGRFRISVTDILEPDKVELLPANVVSLLATNEAERTEQQRVDLASYYLGQKLDRELASLPAQDLVYCGTPEFKPDGTFRPAPLPRTVHLLRRGEWKNQEGEIGPGTLSCVQGVNFLLSHDNQKREGTRREALARWLTHSDNGLAWRSIANRVWQFHFGRGIVDTPSDFGRMGSSPTHPELLEWLAIRLRDRGGSLKDLHRLIVTSMAYRQSSQYQPGPAQVDGDNHLLWRMNRQRLDAESIHDTVLQIAGKLDTRMGGPSQRQFIQTPGIHVTPNVDYASFDPDHPAQFRRSVYRFLFRTLPDPFQEALDCPDGSQCTPVRSSSVTALQALALLHDKFLVRQSEHIATEIANARPSLEQQVSEAYELILGRAPTAEEKSLVGAYVTKHGLSNACRFLLNSNEFIFVD